MTPTQIKKMIKKWDTKNVQEWAEEFDLPPSTVNFYVNLIREDHPERCKPKKPWECVMKNRKATIDKVIDKLNSDPNHTFKGTCP